MQQLFQFLFRIRSLLLFLALEAVCVWLIVRSNTYQGAAFYNTASEVRGEVLRVSEGGREFVNLRQVNETLATENARLRDSLVRLRRRDERYAVDT
ncbi:MAG: rod shape-determining protein MreC, partial [Catalinimonas sp.]